MGGAATATATAAVPTSTQQLNSSAGSSSSTTSSGSSSTVSLKEANLAWIKHALTRRATRPAAIKGLLAWHYELTQEYPLPLPFPVATPMPTPTPMSTPVSASTSVGETEIYRQTVMPGVGRPVLLSLKAKPATATSSSQHQDQPALPVVSGSRPNQAKPKTKTRVKTSGVGYGQPALTPYEEEADYWIKVANTNADTGLERYPFSNWIGAMRLLEFVLAWKNSAPYRDQKWLAFGINRIGLEMGWQTSHARKCLATLQALGLVEVGSLANGKLNQADFDQLKAGLKPYGMSRTLQAKSICYRLLFECRQPLPVFDPALAQKPNYDFLDFENGATTGANNNDKGKGTGVPKIIGFDINTCESEIESETRGEVSETPQLAINTSKRSVAYVGRQVCMIQIIIQNMMLLLMLLTVILIKSKKQKHN